MPEVIRTAARPGAGVQLCELGEDNNLVGSVAVAGESSDGKTLQQFFARCDRTWWLDVGVRDRPGCHPGSSEVADDRDQAGSSCWIELVVIKVSLTVHL